MLYFYYCFESCISVHKIILMFLKSVTKAKVNFQLKYEIIIVISFNFRFYRARLGLARYWTRYLLDTVSHNELLDTAHLRKCYAPQTRMIPGAYTLYTDQSDEQLQEREKRSEPKTLSVTSSSHVTT